MQLLRSIPVLYPLHCDVFLNRGVSHPLQLVTLMFFLDQIGDSIADAWPLELGLMNYCYANKGELEDDSHALCPYAVDDLMLWAHVERNTHGTDYGRRFAYLYSQIPSVPARSGAEKIGVTLRVHGYLGDFLIAPLGNYNG